MEAKTSRRLGLKPGWPTRLMRGAAQRLVGFTGKWLSWLRDLQAEYKRSENKRSAAYALIWCSLLWVANLIVWPLAELATSGFHFSWHQAMKSLGIGTLIAFASIAVVFLVFSFLLLWSAANRHHGDASWPSSATISKKSAFWLLPGWFFVATIVSNGTPWGSMFAQWRIFAAEYLIGGFAVVTVGIWIGDRIGRSRMKWLFDKPKIPSDRAVSVFADEGSVRVVFADGRIVPVPEAQIRMNKLEAVTFSSFFPSNFFDRIVGAALQKDRILLLTECGDVQAVPLREEDT